jgi:Deoxycytidylate deaminase
MNKPQYYLSIAEVVAKRSKCLSRQIGAVIVKDDAIISTGFNGPPRGVPHCGLDRRKVDPMTKDLNIRLNECPRKVLGFGSGEGLEYCPATHAEANAIVQAAKSGVSTDRATMYLTCGVPCKSCLGLIINSGIDTVYCTSKGLYDDISKYIAEYSRIVFMSYD